MWTGIAVALAALLVFVVTSVALIYYEPLAQADRGIEQAVETLHRPAFTRVVVAITNLGTWGVLAIGAAGVVVFIAGRQWFFLANWVISLLGAWALVEGIKVFVSRPRPLLPALVEAFGYSFPSGHAVVSLVGYGMLAYHLRRRATSVQVTAGIHVASIMLVLLVGFSRLYLGVHFLSDIVAGFAIGTVWLTFCISWAEHHARANARY